MPTVDARTRARDEFLASLHAQKSGQVRLVRELLDGGVGAPRILARLSERDADLYQRVIERCVREMEDGGLGSAPCVFDVIAMGSLGRSEAGLGPDQDNALIAADYPDADHARVDTWLLGLCERFTADLDAIGLARCPGHVMATNPLWRKTSAQWEEQVGTWIRRSRGLGLRYCDIFFDFRPVWGRGDLAARLRAWVTRSAPRHFFLRELYLVDEVHGPALGMFGRLLRDPLVAGERVDLKLTGTLPLVNAVRVLALRARVPETGTLARIDALHTAGALDRAERESLDAAFGHLAGLLLRVQVEDREAGRRPGHHVAPASLSRAGRARLVESLRAVRRLRERLRAELTGEIF